MTEEEMSELLLRFSGSLEKRFEQEEYQSFFLLIDELPAIPISHPYIAENPVNLQKIQKAILERAPYDNSKKSRNSN